MSQAIYPPELVQPFLAQLVQALETKGALKTPAVRAAFAAIPRHHFLASYYVQQGHTFTWQLRQAPPWPGEEDAVVDWLAATYADQALVTCLDDEQRPASSSSQPSVMACMLEALELQQGMRVLEIGTGTGYNAALLAHLVDNPALVTTIEVNAELLQSAALLLEESVGPGMYLVEGDGHTGWAAQAPYARLIATANTVTVPDAWLDQLAPGGRLMMDLGGDLTGGLLLAEKATDGQRVLGAFLPQQKMRFMPLRPLFEARSASTRALFRMMAVRETEQRFPVDGPTFSPLVFRNPDFLFFLQWRLPKAALQWWGRENPTLLLPALLDPESQTVLTFSCDSATACHNQEEIPGPWSVQTCGPAPLWQQVQQAYEDWHRLGQPSPRQYQLHIEEACAPYHKELVVSPGEHQAVQRLPMRLPLA